MISVKNNLQRAGKKLKNIFETLRFVLIIICLSRSNFINAQCEFSFSQAIPCSGTEVIFTTDINAPGFAWDFDDDGIIDTTGVSVPHTFPHSTAEEFYVVTLYQDGVACNTETLQVIASPDATIGVIPGTGSMDGNEIRVCSGAADATLSVFNASSTFVNNHSYIINWGDGIIENHDNSSFPNTGFISHDYSGFGYYNLQVTVTGDNGCVTIEDYVFYNGSNPSVGLANPGNTIGLCIPATITFPITNTENNPVGTVYFISVSGEEVATYTQDNVPTEFTYTFTETSCGVSTSTGNYQNAFDVQIEAVNPCASSLATIEPIELSAPPIPELTVSDTFPCIETSTFFTNTSETFEVQNGNCSTNLNASWEISPGVSGVDFIILDGNVFSSNELEIEFITAGTYTVTMTILSEDCGTFTTSQTVTTVSEGSVNAEFDLTATGSANDACVPTIATFTNLSQGELDWYWFISSPDDYEFLDGTDFTTTNTTVQFNEAGTYEVILYGTNACNTSTWDTLITISDVPEIHLEDLEDFCEEATLNFTGSDVYYSENGSEVTSYLWHFPGATPATSTDKRPSGIYYDSPGTYTITIEATNACGTTILTDSFNILQPGALELSVDTTLCIDAPGFLLYANPSGGSWSGTGVSSDGWFDPANASLGGNELTYVYEDAGCPAEGSMVVVVEPLPEVIAGPNQSVCENNQPFFISGGTPANGIWTSDNSGVIVSNSVFDPEASGPGVYTLTYTFTDFNLCENSDTKIIIVNELPEVEAGLDRSICDNPNDIQLSGNYPSGGTWSGVGVTADGIFNVSNTPGLGSYELTYTFTDANTGCSNTDFITITIIENPLADAGVDQDICINNGLISLTDGSPAGGTWTGNGVNSAAGVFDPSIAGIGTHTLTYTFGEAVCETIDEKVIFVQGLPELTLPPSQDICENAALLNLNSATPSGGEWSGTGVTENNFDPATAGIGTHTLTYNYTNPITGCSNEAQVEMNVLSLPEVEAGPDLSICENPNDIQLSGGFPVGGFWSGVGVTADGIFNVSNTPGLGSYELTYTFTDANTGCSNTDFITITIIENPVADAGDDQNICVSDGLISLSDGTPAGGTWTGDGVNSAAGIFDPLVVGVGLHTLTYTFGEGICETIDEKVIYVQALPELTLPPSENLCENAAIIELSDALPIGGEWSGDGIQGNNFNPAISGVGLHTLTYFYINPITGCSNEASIEMNVLGIPEPSVSDTTYCNTPGTVELPLANPLGGSWSGSGIIEGNFDPQLAGGAGQYTLTYAVSNIAGCGNTTESIITIVEPSPIEAGPNDTLCVDNGLYQLQDFYPYGAVWSGPGIIDSINGIFDPELAGGGTHILTFATGIGNCRVEDTRLIEIINLTDAALGQGVEMCISDAPIYIDDNGPVGGIWSGPGIVDGAAGLFDPGVAGGGLHSVTYTYVNEAIGCNAFIVKEITVYAMQQPEMQLPTLGCVNETLQLINNSPDDFTVQWNFGDGNTSQDFEPIHIYENLGTYTISLVAENPYGCIDSSSQDIIVSEAPQPFFEMDVADGCAPLAVNVINQSTGFDVDFSWYFSNGISSFEPNPGPVVFDQGVNDTTYYITLAAVNACGASIHQDSVLVHPQPVAAFGISQESICTPVIANFANITTGSATEFSWNFGNGSTSSDSLPPPQTYYTDTTTIYYTVTLTASNQCGSSTAIQDVAVDPADVQSFFSASVTEGCLPLTVDFSDYSTPGANVDWVFGDGNSSVEFDPIHTFEEAGEYTVIQYASSTCGYDSTTVNITVYPIPEVSFEHNLVTCLGQEVSFNNLSIGTTGHYWDFGDGDTSSITSPVHVFDTPGTYTISLVAFSAFNQCGNIYQSEITVLDAPTAIFEPTEQSGCVPLTLDLINTSENGNFYEWDFGDGNSSTLENPSHIYYEAGNYPISLIVTDQNGCFHDTTIWNIQVHPNPSLNFEYQREEICALPAPVNFINYSENAVGYLWDFGDGNQSFLNDPTHTYYVDGEFEIQLTASTPFGCVDSMQLQIGIYPQPIADFDFEVISGCSPLEVFFNNESDQANGYRWNFGDEMTSEEVSPFHTFSEAGIYDIELIVTNDEVCFDTLRFDEALEVLQNPFAKFDIVENSNGSFQFVNFSNYATDYFWDFSDGTTSLDVNPSHRFLTNGAKQVYLEASSTNGCVDDTLITIVPDFIKALYIPNGFSPLQGIGDVRLFKPKGVGLKEYHIQVFSTYGQLLWESVELSEGQPAESWNGKIGGILLPQDVYIWKAAATFEDGSAWQGVDDGNGGFKTMGSLILLR